MFWGILRNLWKSGSRLKHPVLGSDVEQCLKYLETKKTPTKHVLGLFKNFLKIRFSAQKSGSRPRCRTMLKILWNTQKTPTKHALRHFKKFLKIRFLAEKSGSRLRCPIMLKIPEILENLVLCSKIRFSAHRCRTMLKKTMKHSENTT